MSKEAPKLKIYQMAKCQMLAPSQCIVKACNSHDRTQSVLHYPSFIPEDIKG
jgi:hypothetical protein